MSPTSIATTCMDGARLAEAAGVPVLMATWAAVVLIDRWVGDEGGKVTVAPILRCDGAGGV
jgi:hypothetical protein